MQETTSYFCCNKCVALKFVDKANESLKRTKATYPVLFVVDELPSDLSRYEIVFLDSAESLRLIFGQANRLYIESSIRSVSTI
jgi:hypothetical protein